MRRTNHETRDFNVLGELVNKPSIQKQHIKEHAEEGWIEFYLVQVQDEAGKVVLDGHTQLVSLAQKDSTFKVDNFAMRNVYLAHNEEEEKVEVRLVSSFGRNPIKETSSILLGWVPKSIYKPVLWHIEKMQRGWVKRARVVGPKKTLSIKVRFPWKQVIPLGNKMQRLRMGSILDDV